MLEYEIIGEIIRKYIILHPVYLMCILMKPKGGGGETVNKCVVQST
jgi:hypothetical protein